MLKKIDLPLRSGKVTVVFDYENRQMWKEFDMLPLDSPPKVIHSAVYGFDEEEIKTYFICKVCQKPLKEDEIAWAFWRLQPETCSTECWKKAHT